MELVALAWTIAAIAIAHRWRGPGGQAAAALCATVAGTTFPDLDFVLPLGHRSALTHSILPVLLLWRWPAVAAGLAIGIGTHLAADAFPRAMVGYATIKLPFAGSIGRDASYLWLGVNAAVATGIGVALLVRCFSGRTAIAVAAGMAAIGVAYLFVTDGGWPALAVYGLFGWLAVRRRKLVQPSSR